MATNGLKWHGDDIMAEFKGDIPDALEAAAQEFLDAAQARVPVRRGDLHDSAYISTPTKSTYRPKKIHAKEAKAKEGEVVAGFAAYYAKWIEFGTKKMRAKPFMRPALDESKTKLGNTIAARLRKSFKK